MSALTEEGCKELRRFGWTLGGDFERRYMEDAWVFNLANAVETVAAERDEARAEAARLRAIVQEFAELDSYHGPYGATSEEQWIWNVEADIAARARAALAPVPHEGDDST